MLFCFSLISQPNNFFQSNVIVKSGILVRFFVLCFIYRLQSFLIILFSFLPMFHLALNHPCYILTFLFYSMSLSKQLAFENISTLGTFIVDFFSEYLYSTSPYISSLIICSSVISFALIPSHKFLYCKELYSSLILLIRISNGLSLCKK